MASYAKQIADAVVGVIQGVQGAPATVQYRKANSLYAKEQKPAVIVSIEDETKLGRAFEGTIHKQYKVVIGIYRLCLADIASDLDLSPQFILRVKQALDRASLTGVTVAWDVDLVDNPEWENQPFGNGMEVSMFGLLVTTTEPQNG